MNATGASKQFAECDANPWKAALGRLGFDHLNKFSDMW